MNVKNNEVGKYSDVLKPESSIIIKLLAINNIFSRINIKELSMKVLFFCLEKVFLSIKTSE